MLCNPACRAIAAVATITLLLFIAGPSRAEDLNEKFGDSWDCNSISAGLPLRDACLQANCNFKRQHFWRDDADHGHCVNIANLKDEPAKDSYSLRDRLVGDQAAAYWRQKGVEAEKEKQIENSWSAVAGAAWCDQASGGNCSVAAGSSIGRTTTKKAAEGEAMAQCSSRGTPGCKVILSWQGRGCLYVTGGTKNDSDGTHYVRVMSGNTSDEASQKCSSAGFSCDKVIGGCVK